jgi:hypothetical protein
LWSQVYDREIERGGVQENRSIARALQRWTCPRRRHGGVKLVSTSRRATPRPHRQAKLAIEYFNQAIARDSNYALAWSGLASARSQLYDVAGYPPAQLVPSIRQAAERALALDSTLAEPYARLGWIHTHSWEWPAARPPQAGVPWIERNLSGLRAAGQRGWFETLVCLLARAGPLAVVAYNVAGSYLHLRLPAISAAVIARPTATRLRRSAGRL